MAKHLINLFLASAGTAAILAFAPAANANLVLNGGFQDGTPEASLFEQVNPVDSNPMPNWTVSAGNLDWIHGYWEGSSGFLSDFSVDLSGFNAQVTVQQLITGLVTGQVYTLTFDTALNPDHDDLPQSLNWSLGPIFGSALGILDPNLGWTLNTFSFLWTDLSTSALLAFSSTVPSGTNCCFGPALDSVELNAVPLPAALPLLAAGLGAMGFLARRRKRRAALTA